MSHRNNFRLDIQGLRAIAVLSVVIFHINPILLSGGYIGVDIFFVISGYLIMGFIWRDLKDEKFYLLTFYTKRVYRLFPALFAMVMASTIAAYFILLPNEAATYLTSMFSTLFYFSNFYFYTQADYFNDAMAYYPLLHTWSLSVEEQFYMLFPLLLLWIYTIKRTSVYWVLSFLALVSLFLSQWYIDADASFAFFSSPTRFFQFIAGGLIAIYLQKHDAPRRFNDTGVMLGLIVLGSTLYFYTEETLFPGINALLPTFGTVLVLYFGIYTKYTKWILENSVFTLVGNASYSIYLWHWPLIVFYKLKVSPILSWKVQGVLLVVSVLLGILSWYFIENKTRRHRLENVNIKPIAIVISGSVLWSLVSVAIFHYQPHKASRYKEKASAYLHYNTNTFRAGSCFLTSKYNDVKFFDKQKCVTYKEGKKNYLLLGDSHAAHYYPAMKEMIRHDETLTQVTASGCAPIYPFKGAKRCSGLNEWAYETLIKQKHFDAIILSGNWRYENRDYFEKSLKQLLKYTSHVIVFGPSMEYKQSLPRLLVNLKEGEESSQIYKKAAHFKVFTSIDKMIKSYASMKNVSYVSILDIECSKKGCMTVTPDGTPMNFDNGHLTKEGAFYILRQVEDKIFDRD